SLPSWCNPADSFFGLPIHRWDGRDVFGLTETAGEVIESIRATRRPALAVLEVDRLSSHTNADDERVYRPEAERHRAQRRGDPVRILRTRLLENGVDEVTLDRLDAEIDEELERAVSAALRAAEPRAEFDAKAPLSHEQGDPLREYRGDPNRPEHTMVES